MRVLLGRKKIPAHFTILFQRGMLIDSWHASFVRLLRCGLLRFTCTWHLLASCLCPARTTLWWLLLDANCPLLLSQIMILDTNSFVFRQAVLRQEPLIFLWTYSTMPSLLRGSYCWLLYKWEAQFIIVLVTNYQDLQRCEWRDSPLAHPDSPQSFLLSNSTHASAHHIRPDHHDNLLC